MSCRRPRLPPVAERPLTGRLTAGSALGLVLEILAGERIGYHGPAEGGARQGTGTKDAGDGVRDQPRGRGGAGCGDPQAADKAEAQERGRTTTATAVDLPGVSGQPRCER